MENGTNGKHKFVFLGWQMINGSLRLLFQQMSLSMSITTPANIGNRRLQHIQLKGNKE